jgi:hypothetical protein
MASASEAVSSTAGLTIDPKKLAKLAKKVVKLQQRLREAQYQLQKALHG